MNPPHGGNPVGGLGGAHAECSTEEMYQHLVTSLGMDADLPGVAQPPPPPLPLSYQHHPPLEDAFATMGISGNDSIYNYNRSFSGEFQHDQWLGQQNPVARDAASAFGSNPMLGGGYQYHPGPLAYRAQPAPSNHGFLSHNYNYSWRGSNQGSWSPVCPCAQPLCLRCNDLVTLATNSRTSKVLQERIKTMNRAQIGRLFSEFKNKMEKMMTHAVANFVSLNLLEVFTEAQIDQIIRRLCSSSSALVRLCEDNRGGRAMKKLLERIREPNQKALLTRTLKPYVLRLIKNEEGCSVISFCLTNFTDEENKFILEEVAQNCYELGTDKKGYSVLSRIIKSFQFRQHECFVLNEVIGNAIDLAHDEYGNYVVQDVLQLQFQETRYCVLDRLNGHYHSLSINKYGSNVVEICLILAPQVGQLDRIISELLSVPDTSELFLDSFGNYVMQTALQISKELSPGIHQHLLGSLRMNEARLRTTHIGKQLLKWLPRSSIRYHY